MEQHPAPSRRSDRRLARRRPEVLAPAGAPDCLPAAVAGGADAVFLGLRHFNARGRAENFRKADLPHHVAYLHGHGLKCYVVLNTLVHDDELPKAVDLAAAAHAAGVDAAIIQDLGLWQVLAAEVPGLARHASTQMTIHDPAQVAVLAGLGAERVILARELSLAEVAACCAEAARHGIEIEHFVHGALCYAFSGQCLMSNFAGCRSANRGTCAQNCRFDYAEARTADDAVGAAGASAADNADAETLISMKDLNLVGQIGALADAGVASLKIEGRLKGPDYVYTTSRVYRAATDAWAAGQRFDTASARELLKDVFARAHTEAPLRGDYSEASRLHRYAPQHDRRPDAILERCDRRRGEAVLRGAVRPGQGFAYAVGTQTGGFLVTAVRPLPGPQHRGAARTDGDPRVLARIRIAPHGPALPAELPLFRNADHERAREAAAAMARVAPPNVEKLRAQAALIAVDLEATGHAGAPLRVTARSADGRTAQTDSRQDLQPATSAPMTAAALGDSLGALGGTAYRLGEVRCRVVGDLFLPAAELKRLRRVLVADLDAQPVPAPGTALPDTGDGETREHAPISSSSAAAPAAASGYAALALGTPRQRPTAVIAVVGSLAAARAARAAGAAAVWLDDARLDLWSAACPALLHREALGELSASGAAPSLFLRLPATAPTPPKTHLARIADLHLGLVAGQLGQLIAAQHANVPCVADAALNAFSTQTVLAHAALGADMTVISLECSGREIARLAARLAHKPARLAVIAAGRVPAMLTRQEHGLLPGQTRTIRAVPRDGGLPYVIARRCRDTAIFEARRLCAPEAVQATRGLVDAWILECADQEPEPVATLVAAYVALREDRTTPQAVTDLTLRHASEGIFPGHLERGSRELDAWAERMG